MKKLFILIVFVIIVISIYYNFVSKNNTEENVNQPEIIEEAIIENDNTIDNTLPPNNLKEAKIDEILDSKISLVAIGDIMCQNTQYKDAYKNGAYDFSYVFEDIKEYIENADIAVGNLETTLAGSQKGYNGYPLFNTPEALATDLKELGIDVLTTCNNHCLDSGYSGLESTIDFLDEADLPHTGTFKNEEAQNTILYQEVNGIKIAFLAYTYGTNGIPIPKGKEYCINLIDKDLILSQLELAKKENPDIICVSMHWGIEYQRQPNDEQKDLADFLFENGVDIILGSHPHVLQPFEKREIKLENGTTKDGFVIYSLGNFMAAQNKANTLNSIILNLDITKHNGKISIDNVSYTPIYFYSYPAYHNYKVLDIQKTLDAYENGENPLSTNSNSLLKNELKSITDLLEK